MLTFDVEDWFQVENLRPLFPPSSWAEQEWRVANSTRTILDLLDVHGVRSTFFILGCVADREPDLVREIARRGHEVACHGQSHVRPLTLSAAELREDLRRAKGTLEDLAGAEVNGYRAPSFSLDQERLEIVFDEGFLFDSSYHPFSLHDRYGSISDPGREVVPGVFRFGEGAWEIGLPVVQAGPLPLPASGGGYFRLFPGFVFRALVRRILKEQRHYVSYLHSWEFDPDQPRVSGLDWTSRFRHYNCLGRTGARMQRLVEGLAGSGCRFVPIGEFIAELETTAAEAA